MVFQQIFIRESSFAFLACSESMTSENVFHQMILSVIVLVAKPAAMILPSMHAVNMAAQLTFRGEHFITEAAVVVNMLSHQLMVEQSLCIGELV